MASIHEAGVQLGVVGVVERDAARRCAVATGATRLLVVALQAAGQLPVRDEAHVRAVLGIPIEVIPLNVIPVGHPTGADKPKEKFRAENVHWGRW